MKFVFGVSVGVLIAACMMLAFPPTIPVQAQDKVHSGYSIVWDMELQRPEAQKAIGLYIEQHCKVAGPVSGPYIVCSWR